MEKSKVITCPHCGVEVMNIYLEFCETCKHNLKTHEIYKFNEQLSKEIQEYKDVNRTLIATLFSKDEQYIDVFINMVDLRDSYTGRHSARVAELSVEIAKLVGVKIGDLLALKRYVKVHDVGKVYIPDSILRKPSSLNSEEREIVKAHTIKGAQLIENVDSLQLAIPIVRNHHEWWDGSGYPDGLRGNNINFWARIVAIADAIDSMYKDRPYRNALSLDKIIFELERCAGIQFDPNMVEILIKANEWEKMLKKSNGSCN